MTMEIEQVELDVDALMAPVSADLPAGESLRYDGTYDVIREARRQDDDLPQGVWETKRKEADWDKVIGLTEKAIAEQSKDLQLAAWLAEALAHRHGVGGLRTGLKLITEMCGQYWNELHPEIDDGDIDARLTILEWLDKQWALASVNTPISVEDSNEGRPFLFSDWEGALFREQHGIKDESKPTKERIMGALSLTPSAAFARMRRTIDEIIKEVDGLRAVLEEAAGEYVFSAKETRETLTRIRSKFASELKQRGDPLDEELEAEEAEGAEGEEGEDDGGGFGIGGKIRNRAHAYALLSQAADYLMRIEPHSPTPYLVRRAVTWGSLSATELLNELVNDQNDLAQIYSLLGIKQESGS